MQKYLTGERSYKNTRIQKLVGIGGKDSNRSDKLKTFIEESRMR